jgi:hypothetical protein
VGFQREADLAGDNGGQRRVWAVPVGERQRCLVMVSQCEMRKVVVLSASAMGARGDGSTVKLGRRR